VKSYEYAVLEVDVTKLPPRVRTAEADISSSLVEINESTELWEPNALRDALRVLQLIAEHERWIWNLVCGMLRFSENVLFR